MVVLRMLALALWLLALFPSLTADDIYYVLFASAASLNAKVDRANRNFINFMQVHAFVCG